MEVVMNSVEIVERFWARVWQARNPEAIDEFVAEDFVITNAGQDIVGRENFKAWVRGFLGLIEDLEFEVQESFQNADGSRVASRWIIRGRNNGVLGTEPDGRPIEFSGTAVWAVAPDGTLLHNWVERASWELYRRLTA
ncbi:DUF4440 domain-containing protein [Pseudonocardiaceae bacterium YIM PH 21723]|nr:DUF4440 domain-containing protein [Pseudonocardiaceae bacterium YIM PH 21723]